MCENVPNISQQHLEEKKKSRKKFFVLFMFQSLNKYEQLTLIYLEEIFVNLNT